MCCWNGCTNRCCCRCDSGSFQSNVLSALSDLSARSERAVSSSNLFPVYLSYPAYLTEVGQDTDTDSGCNCGCNRF